MTRHARFLAHVGAHEIRPAVVPDVCACGAKLIAPRSGRCERCELLRADWLLERSLGEPDEDGWS